ncbi:MAG: molybdate ABC transporter substrate-binding protein [Candidatus Acidiferrales bacterium]
MRKHSILAVAVVCAFLFSQRAAAQTGEVHVLASNGIKAVMEDLLSQSEHAIGATIAVQYMPTANVMQKIAAGEPFDVTIITPEATAELAKQGKTVDAGTPISRAGIGIGIRRGAPRPDITTPEALKTALLGTKAIVYAPRGASTPAITHMLEALGIAEAMKAKTILLQGSDLTIAAVLDGRADFVMTLVSEMLPVNGLEVLGPLPDEFQHYISFSAAVSANSKNTEAANALIKFLAGPSAVPVIKARGMEPD